MFTPLIGQAAEVSKQAKIVGDGIHKGQPWEYVVVEAKNVVVTLYQNHRDPNSPCWPGSGLGVFKEIQDKTYVLDACSKAKCPHLKTNTNFDPNDNLYTQALLAAKEKKLTTNCSFVKMDDSGLSHRDHRVDDSNGIALKSATGQNGINHSRKPIDKEDAIKAH